jgi:Fe2+ transport system protein FeoA
VLLDQAEEKKPYKIIEVAEGRLIKLKLTSMGIYPEVIVRIIKNDKFGPVILAIRSSRVSLGRSLAKKIIVEEICEK